MSKIIVQWQGNMNFKGYDDGGRQVMMDAAQIYGGTGTGIRPMELMLMALGGCTGIEVGHVLNKMRVPYEQLTVEVEGERAETIPKVFTHIKVKYVFKGKELTKEKVEKAINLGAMVYCSAANMMQKACPIDYEYEVNGVSYTYDKGERVSEAG